MNETEHEAFARIHRLADRQLAGDIAEPQQRELC
jgi:hypothetical protein